MIKNALIQIVILKKLIENKIFFRRNKKFMENVQNVTKLVAFQLIKWFSFSHLIVYSLSWLDTRPYRKFNINLNYSDVSHYNDKISLITHNFIV